MRRAFSVLDEATIAEFAECVRRNEGLRTAIRARGLDVGATMRWLKENRRDVFKNASADKTGVLTAFWESQERSARGAENG